VGAGWLSLGAEQGLSPWRPPTEEWFLASTVRLDPKNPRLLKGEPGEGILVNGAKGRTRNLLSKEHFGDLDVFIEFLVPCGSNSGVKLMGLYEIQILDSWGAKKVRASDCGGIYPRAEELPTYRHIDEGIPPRMNASRRPGEWQTLEIAFQAPRFDEKGKKIAHARFLRVALNGSLLHDNVEVVTPTGAAWRLQKEVPRGPLLLQADHGPVAFRSILVRPR
jgi:hypothetical protein